MGIRVEFTVDRPTLSRGRRRTRVIVAALALALTLPTVALANHIFTDVPAASSFHGNISSVAGAGVAAGCGGSNYCPSGNVTREQMAAFLHRGLGRIAEGDFLTPVTGQAATAIGSVSITPGLPGGAIAGANQFIRAEYTGTVTFTNITGCPCSVGVYLMANGEWLSGYATGTTVTTANTFSPLSVSGVLPVTGTAPVPVTVYAYMVSGGGPTSAYSVYANVNVMTVPFGNTGSDVITTVGEVDKSDPLAAPAGD